MYKIDYSLKISSMKCHPWKFTGHSCSFIWIHDVFGTVISNSVKQIWGTKPFTSYPTSNTSEMILDVLFVQSASKYQGKLTIFL